MEATHLFGDRQVDAEQDAGSAAGQLLVVVVTGPGHQTELGTQKEMSEHQYWPPERHALQVERAPASQSSWATEVVAPSVSESPGEVQTKSSTFEHVLESQQYILS